VTCPLCEATCGLQVELDGARVVSVRGDAADVFSRGYICPKGTSLGALHDDPDRLRQPMLKRDGRHVPVSWDEAFEEIDARLGAIIAEHGRDAVALYLGNPAAHHLAWLLYGRAVIKALGSRNIFSASTVDQMPKHFSSAYLFGDPFSIPVPDLDRTDYLLMLGANPLVSNGSLMTAADVRSRLRGIQQRGGRIVVVDPRRSRTAQLADEHLAIRPGTDALLLFALVQTVIADGLVGLDHLEQHVSGLDEVSALAAPFTAEAVAPHVGVEADVIRRLAHELAAAPSAAVYGRIGTTTQAFGSLASWLVDVLNVLTGNLDRPGGAMFPLAAAGQANSAATARRTFRHDRYRSRVRDLPEVLGELPVSTMADEMLTPGPGQVRALISICGNPCLSTPNAGRLDEAIAQLDFVISHDIYLNETTRHADVILPGPSPLERPHYDLALYQFAVRNIANFTPAQLPSDVPQEWRTALRLVGVLTGQGPNADVDAIDDVVAADVAGRAGLDPSVAAGRRGPERLLDLLLRSGPYQLTLAQLEAAPHGIDLGALQPRLPGVLATASGTVELAPAALTADVPRLRAVLDSAPPDAASPDGMVLVGRRQLASNNSWMHNISTLVRGSNRCTAQLHPDDAARLGVVDGAAVEVRSRTGSVQVPAEVTADIRPGVVSIPHGWGHGVDGTDMAVAAAHAGANSNLLADELLVDALSGNAVFSGIPVTVTAVPELSAASTSPPSRRDRVG
jgi:anaerobic selenocysteine-containing dehydrogenase